ncbi:MAG: tetratricopeptide repeat protein [Deltaproteobacteria bacterium]|nr:tetratricopeptide repeat protein [Deltaproteobacteria bacterium]
MEFIKPSILQKGLQPERFITEQQKSPSALPRVEQATAPSVKEDIKPVTKKELPLSHPEGKRKALAERRATESAQRLKKRHAAEAASKSPPVTTPEASGETRKGAKQPSRDDFANRDVYLYTASTYESKRDYYQALYNYKKALELDPENYIILNNISSMLIRTGSYEEAITYLKNALAIKNTYTPSLINLGIACIRLGKLTEGEGYFTKALSIEPSNKHAIVNLAILQERTGDLDKAYASFHRLSEMGDIQGYLGLARISEKKGKNLDAARIYREILSMGDVDPKLKKLARERLSQVEQ